MYTALLYVTPKCLIQIVSNLISNEVSLQILPIKQSMAIQQLYFCSQSKKKWNGSYCVRTEKT